MRPDLSYTSSNAHDVTRTDMQAVMKEALFRAAARFQCSDMGMCVTLPGVISKALPFAKTIKATAEVPLLGTA